MELTLSNGVQMPAVGIGTFMMNPEQAETAVFDALICGYRMIDTANAYMNERAVGRGMRASGVERKDIFLSTKIWPSEYEKEGAVDKTLDMLAPHDTKLVSWYPLGHGDKVLLEEPILAELADKYGKTTAQIILRWHIQRGTCVIPGSTNPEHIKENIDIFDFFLTDDEMNRIQALDRNARFYNPPADMEDKYVTFVIDLDAQP